MKKMVILAGALLVAGCASSSSRLTTIGGYYYLAGDKDCALQLQTGPTRIACGTKQREMRGYRDALTQPQLVAYQEAQLRQIQRSIAVSEIANSLNQISQSFLNSSQQILQRSRQFQAPQVQPIPNYSSVGTRYRFDGNAMYGSDGTTTRQIGHTIFGTDGQRCQIVGQNMFCKK